MGSLKSDEEDIKELDDSGYVQDEGPHKSYPEKRKPVLLDLSDDVLLCILQYCRPIDLKSLGFSCTRLAALVRDRTLWQRVDAREVSYGPRRMRWLLAHALHAGTTQLMIRGYAVESRTCNGYHNVNRPVCWGGERDDDEPPSRICQFPGLANGRPDSSVTVLWPEEELMWKRSGGGQKTSRTGPDSSKAESNSTLPGPNSSKAKLNSNLPGPNSSKAESNSNLPGPNSSKPEANSSRAVSNSNLTGPNSKATGRVTRVLRSNSRAAGLDSKATGSDSRATGSDSRATGSDSRATGPDSRATGPDSTATGPDSQPVSWDRRESTCPGPVFTLTPCLLRQLRGCCALTELALDYCNINCARITLAQFPSQLKTLSLRGSMCYNMSVNKSVLFMIQDHLPNLENLDLSECVWLDASCLLPLSKLANLRRLAMTDCSRMREFVAYASLSARYGFRKLQMFDLRGSPVGDSEVAALGWLPELEELYLSSSKQKESDNKPKHNHFADDPLPYARELTEWEKQEPEYFKSLLKHNKRKNKLDKSELCQHGLPFNQCVDGIDEPITKNHARDLKRSANKYIGEPGPSKRKRSNSDDDNGTSDEDEDMDEACDNKNISNNKINNQTNNKIANSGNLVGNGEGSNQNANGGPLGNEEDLVANDNVEAPNGENLDANENDGQEVNVIEVVCMPRAHVLYVNIGQQLNSVRRIINIHDLAGEDNREFANMQQIHPLADTVDQTKLITDSAIRSFGHSDDDNVNYFHIGGPPNAQHSRPNKSNLKILSIVGYKHITDRSLEHLRTSAPKLEKIDFRRTGVSKRGVEKFKLTRPDVDIKYSGFSRTDYVYYDVCESD